ncbi:MAG: hypothetical protein WAL47_16740 [Pyrinomonadaceae bacterium]
MATLKAILEVLALFVQIIGFPVAAISLFMARKEAKASRDLQIALTLSESFRSRWEGGWSDIMFELKEVLKTSDSDEVPVKYRDHLYKMMNWIDWLGILIKTKSLSEKKIIFDSIRPQLVDIIKVSRPLIRKDTQLNDEDYWAGLRTVAAGLNIKLEDPA